MQYAMRWILIVPAALGGAIAANFVLHWVLLASCNHGDSIVQLTNDDRDSAERFLVPLAAAIGFVLAGSKTAPRYRFQTALLLGCLLVVGSPILAIWIASTKLQVQVSYGTTQWLLHFSGVVVACLVVMRMERDRAVDTRNGNGS